MHAPWSMRPMAVIVVPVECDLSIYLFNIRITMINRCSCYFLTCHKQVCSGRDLANVVFSCTLITPSIVWGYCEKMESKVWDGGLGLNHLTIHTVPAIDWRRISWSCTSEKNLLSKRSVNVMRAVSDDRRSLVMRDRWTEREREEKREREIERREEKRERERER